MEKQPLGFGARENKTVGKVKESRKQEEICVQLVWFASCT